PILLPLSFLSKSHSVTPLQVPFCYPSPSSPSPILLPLSFLSKSHSVTPLLPLQVPFTPLQSHSVTPLLPLQVPFCYPSPSSPSPILLPLFLSKSHSVTPLLPLQVPFCYPSPSPILLPLSFLSKSHSVTPLLPEVFTRSLKGLLWNIVETPPLVHPANPKFMKGNERNEVGLQCGVRGQGSI
ncbi:hypothetical protein J4Q44_G00130550, partial [Coregonus suidteri]